MHKMHSCINTLMQKIHSCINTDSSINHIDSLNPGMSFGLARKFGLFCHQLTRTKRSRITKLTTTFCQVSLEYQETWDIKGKRCSGMIPVFDKNFASQKYSTSQGRVIHCLEAPRLRKIIPLLCVYDFLTLIHYIFVLVFFALFPF